jgi:hypothetical protein
VGAGDVGVEPIGPSRPARDLAIAAAVNRRRRQTSTRDPAVWRGRPYSRQFLDLDVGVGEVWRFRRLIGPHARAVWHTLSRVRGPTGPGPTDPARPTRPDRIGERPSAP